MPLIVSSPPESRTIIFDNNGKPAPNAKLFFFNAGTTTPQVTYTNSALSVPHANPVLTDSQGRVPRIYLLEGKYRIRVERSDGVLIYDDDNLQGSFQTAEQGETPAFDENGIARTGDIKPAFDTSQQAGWVRMNGRTIGSAASLATERANADVEDLYTFLWERNASVEGGRGGSAAADWSANKPLVIPDARGRAFFVSDTMGNTAAGRLTDAIMSPDGETLGATGGAQEVTLTEAQLPALTKTTTTNGAHTHSYTAYVFPNGFAGGGTTGGIGNTSQTTGSAGAHNHSVSFGGDESHSNTPPALLVGAYIKL